MFFQWECKICKAKVKHERAAIMGHLVTHRLTWKEYEGQSGEGDVDIQVQRQVQIQQPALNNNSVQTGSNSMVPAVFAKRSVPLPIDRDVRRPIRTDLYSSSSELLE